MSETGPVQRNHPTTAFGDVPAVTEERMRSALDRLEAALNAGAAEKISGSRS
jgi:hypothetical protein